MAKPGYTINGTRVAQARQQRLGITQGALADLLGIHRVTLTRIENGTAPVSLELLEKLTSALGCSRAWLLGEPESTGPMDQLADALAKINAGFVDLADLVETLNGRAASHVEKVAA